jgi:hypothetical protein
MATEKVLKKIREEVQGITESLELFLDVDVQPSVTDCDALQKQLTNLQESVAVYKFQKKEKELSPSFNIHAKVSEKAADISVIKEQVIPESKTEIPAQKIVEKDIRNEPEKKAAPLVIGINDKFRFINELFKQNNSEYNIAIEQLANLQSWPEAELYLSSLKGLYDWKDNSEVVIYFYSVIKKRFFL